MIRRKFLSIIINFTGISLIKQLSSQSAFASDIISKIHNRLNPPPGPHPESMREEVLLPETGVKISVETALNSRCTCDYDDNPKVIHWGMFDKTKKLSPAQIEQIITYAKIPRFTNEGIEIKSEKNMLTFIIDNHITQPLKDWVMVESGMQQQAVGLVCAALGAGYVFKGQGINGKSISENKFATVKFRIDAMKPSYNGAYWSTAAPLEPNPWESGTLPDPVRQGNNPLVSTLAELKIINENGRHISINDLSQLLWAARGRTPHYYRSAPWSMTIPTYQGKYNISEVFLISNGTVSKYINWKDNNPTHSIEIITNINTALEKLLSDKYYPNNSFIVLSKNENPARSLWEIGYQLLNLILQAHSLGVSYKAILLDESQKIMFQDTGINEPVAALLLQSD